MKYKIAVTLFAAVLLSLNAVTSVHAQPVYTALHSFTPLTSSNTNSDGKYPNGDLLLSGNTLYGTAQLGGTSGYGTLFAINTDGTSFTNLYNFTNGSDGAYPIGGLILSGSNLFGVANLGGSSGYGTVFAINTNGTGFTSLYTFTNGSDGANPAAGLILSGKTLFGTASGWGLIFGPDSDSSTVFAINTDGTGFTNLYNFTYGTNGAHPFGSLILSGNTLYGTSTTGYGAVFAVNTNGTGFTNLYRLTYNSTNSGSDPQAGLILSGNTLYGTTELGPDTYGWGTVFAVNTNGTGFTNLYIFTAPSGNYMSSNSDGDNINSGLLLSGNTLYGTADNGGISSCGTVFAINTDGTGFTNLYNFTPSEGGNPLGGLILSGNTLYGTEAGGFLYNEAGDMSGGTVFSLSLPVPQLTIIPSGTNVILSWPTNVAGFSYTGYTLQSTTNLVSPVVWTTVSPAPVVVNGQNTVTNPISGAQQFYRLQAYVPSINWTSIEADGTEISNYTATYETTNTFQIGFTLGAPAGYLQSANIIATLGSQHITLWSQTLNGGAFSGVVNFSLPGVGSWQIAANIFTAGGVATTLPLTQVGNPSLFPIIVTFDPSTTVTDPTYSYVLGTGGSRYFITLSDTSAGATIYHTSSSAETVAEPALPWAGGTAYSGTFERNMLSHSQTIWIQARKRGLTSSNLIKFILPASS
jgi:uncharacterized repeat protein (TIGR03803 family)